MRGEQLPAGLTDTEREALDRAVTAAVNFHSFDAGLEMSDFDVADAIVDTATAASAPGGLTGVVARIKADAYRQGRADLAAKVEAVAALLCERHQYSSPTRQPCAACSQDARAVLTDPTEPCAEFGEHPRGGHADAVRRASDG